MEMHNSDTFSLQAPQRSRMANDGGSRQIPARHSRAPSRRLCAGDLLGRFDGTAFLVLLGLETAT